MKDRDLTKKLLYRFKKDQGAINEEVETEFKHHSENVKKENNPNKQSLVEASAALMTLKKTNVHLSEHIDLAFRQLNQIIKLLK